MSALEVRMLDIACEVIASEDEMMQRCIGLLGDEIASGHRLSPMIRTQEGEHYLICMPQTAPRFNVIMGYFDGSFWSGVVYVSDENLNDNSHLLKPLQAHFGSQNISLDLASEACVFVESSVIESTSFGAFWRKALKALPSHIALSTKLNATLADARFQARDLSQS